MKKIAGFVYDHSRLIIIFVVLINIISLVSFINFSLDTDFLASFNKGNPKVDEFNALNEKYATGETVSVLVEEDTPILDRGNLLGIYDLRQELSEIDGVAEVQSLLPEQIVTPAGATPLDRTILDNRYDQVSAFIDNQYFMTDEFLSANGLSTILIVSLEPDADTDMVLETLKDLKETSALTISLAGDSIIENTLFDYILRIIFILPPAAVILIVTVFYLVLRDRRLTALAMIPAGLAALWTFGSIFWSGQELNLVTAITPIFIIVIGSAYGLHLVSHYQDYARNYTDKRELLIATMDMVGMPIFLATLTTMAGFVSLVWTEVLPMRQMGIFITLGIAYAGFMALFFVPAVLSRGSVPRVHEQINDNILTRIVLRVSRWKVAVIMIFSVIVIVSAFFIPNLHVVSNQLMFFKESSEIRQTFSKVEENFGSAIPLIGEFKTTGGMTVLADYEYATKVLETERELEQLPGIKTVVSVLDIVQGMYGMTTGQDTYPENPMVLQGMIGQIEPADLQSWISEDGLKFMIRTGEITSDEIEAIEQFVEDNSDVVRIISGMPVLFDEMNTLVVQSQIQSLGLALALIFIMLWIALRKITAALAGMLPIVITICAILGMLVITDFQLNILTANLSAITIGIGVDYSIHVISGIFYYRKQGMDNPEAVTATLKSVSRPVLANAFGLAIGYSAMFFSPLFIHIQAAGVMWIAMVASSMAALLLLSTIYSRQRPIR